MLHEFFIYGLIAGSGYALVALGFALIYRTVRFFNFAHGAVYTIGAYLAFVFYVLLGLPLAVAVLLAVPITGLIGVGFEWAVFRPMRARNASSLTLLIASLGLLILGQNVIALIFGNDTQVIHSGVVHEGAMIFGARITTIQETIFVAALVLFGLTAALLRLTRLGVALRAVANDPELARVAGVKDGQVITFAYFLGSCLAAAASVMIALDTNMTPTMGLHALLYGMVAVIVGGAGSLWGAYFGGLLLGVAQNVAVWQISADWQDVVAFVILIVFLLVRPEGLTSLRMRKGGV